MAGKNNCARDDHPLKNSLYSVLKGRLGAPLTQVAFHFKRARTSFVGLSSEEGSKKKNAEMSKSKKAILIAVVFLILFFCGISFWRELEPSLNAANYLEGRGYSYVRILRYLADGHGCEPEDKYRFAFDAIPRTGKKRMEGNICGNGEDIWYEEK